MNSLNYPLSKEVEEIHLERPLLERKPGELLKLISRLDRLDSDDYKSKVGQLLYRTQRRCQTFLRARSKESTIPLTSENKRRVRQNVGGRCHIQS